MLAGDYSGWGGDESSARIWRMVVSAAAATKGLSPSPKPKSLAPIAYRPSVVGSGPSASASATAWDSGSACEDVALRRGSGVRKTSRRTTSPGARPDAASTSSARWQRQSHSARSQRSAAHARTSTPAGTRSRRRWATKRPTPSSRRSRLPMPITNVVGGVSTDNGEAGRKAEVKPLRSLLFGSGLAWLAEACEQLGGGQGRALAFDLLATLAGFLVVPLAAQLGAGGIRHRSTPG